MARVGYVATEDAQGEAGVVMRKMEAKGAGILNLHRAIANSPNALRNFVRLGNSLLMHGALPPVLREIAILRVGQMAGANYEWAHHVPIARQVGVTDEQIEALESWETSEHFNDPQRAVLRYVEIVSAAGKPSDDVFGELRSHLNEAEAAELTLVVGYWGMVARFLIAIQVDLEQPFHQYLPT